MPLFGSPQKRPPTAPQPASAMQRAPADRYLGQKFLGKYTAGKFLGAYIDKGIFEKDPFVSLDQEGVGDLIRIAAERGRAARPGIKMGICGEHGGDPASIQFCESVGLDYVSCSPFRVPIARLAAAQAALAGKK